MDPTSLIVDITATLPASSALDVGCGNGRNANYLTQMGWQVTAIDTIPVELPPSIHFEQSSLLAFTPNQNYDVVLCLMVLHFLPDKDAVAANIRKLQSLTAPSGTLVISVFTERNPPGARPYLFARDELLSYFEGWKVVREDYELAPPIYEDGKMTTYHVQRLVVRKPK